jgi:hypothetical protein
MRLKITNLIDWKNVLKELVGKRTELFERFVKDPANIRLAREIKRLDDQILECREHLQHAQESDKSALRVRLA